MDHQQCCARAAAAHTGTPAASHDVSEIPWKRQAVVAGQHRVSSILSDGSRWSTAIGVSGGQGGATLAPAGGQDGTPRAGAHPQTKAVHAGTTTGVGLKGALAHCYSVTAGPALIVLALAEAGD
jgi:hypothetical protein